MQAFRLSSRMASHLVVFVLLATALGLSAGLVFAHAKGPKVSPAHGSELAEAPEELTLTFDEAVRLTAVRLYDASNSEINLSAKRSLEAVRERRIPLPPLGAGQYRVEWRVLSADGHPVSGAFSFTIAPPQ